MDGYKTVRDIQGNKGEPWTIPPYLIPSLQLDTNYVEKAKTM